jgi:hypothetical protein
MENGQVIDATERFITRGKQLGEQAPDIDGRIIYLDTHRKGREMVETAVEQSAASIIIFLKSNGQRKEADQIFELAYQYAVEDFPVDAIRETLTRYLEEVCPHLYPIYQFLNR